MSPIPFNDINGVLPPYLGASPGGPAALMSPYIVTLVDVIDRFATSPARTGILRGLLDYRAALRATGVSSGFQWIDGSFVEDVEAHRGRPPADIDVVTFVSVSQSHLLNDLVLRHERLVVDRAWIKETFKCDAFFVTLKSSPTSIVSLTRYWFGLFSHQRDTMLWKGMLQVSLDTPDDDLDAYRALSSRGRHDPEAAP